MEKISKQILKQIVVTIITWQAKLVLARYRPKIIAVTGSVGKTSTKDAIFAVLAKFKTVRKSEKSFNSEIGLPLTILGASNGWNSFFTWFEIVIHGFIILIKKQPYPEYLVLEVGAGKPNDIKSVAKWLLPDIVVVTRFPDKPVHVEFFGSAEKVIEEKSAIALAMKKDGVLILNHDDEKVYALHDKAKRRTVSYGMHDNATYRFAYPAYLYKTENGVTIPTGINFKLEYGGNTFPVNLPHIIGMHYIGSALASIACANELGCDLLQSISAVSEYVNPPGRLSLIEGINNSVIIDDTYNASPVAMEAAIEVLAEMKGKNKIAVLGDMLELGKFTDEAHRAIGQKVAGVADMLVVVGPRAKLIAESAIDSGFKAEKIHSFDSSKITGEYLKGIIRKGDIVLLKGSQGIRLERAVEAIMAHPELKTKLLCRQEKEWQIR
ncbi:MAG TPA: UDP-N-acetylmuramoyl-tripeptide--D-alanyl-D-alanine ligase [Candidatus Paceibacterota bacterium]|nr:UDP-N-acetylmuramoyl-tripeptide--D-alanyl-D-alanine ligase [Candidatus Paceibacterota bacterium]